MTHALLTLIAPMGASLPMAAIEALIQTHGAEISKCDWLHPTQACDLTLTGGDLAALGAALPTACDGWRVDALLQPGGRSPKRLLISDMDSTIIEQECIDELAAELGLKEHVAAITARAMNGELDFAEALTQRVALLKGLTRAQMQRVLDERITLMPGASTLLATLRAQGVHTVLVSGGFTFFTAAIAARAGFHSDEANQLELDGEWLTGRVIPPILGKEAKRASLIAHRNRLGLGEEETIAIGDGANDLPMILEAGLGVAYHAKPSVEAAAPHRMRYNDLSALLYTLGIHVDDWEIAK